MNTRLQSSAAVVLKSAACIRFCSNRSVGPTTRVSNSAGLDEGPKFTFLTTFQVMLMLLVQEARLQTQGSMGSHQSLLHSRKTQWKQCFGRVDLEMGGRTN